MPLHGALGELEARARRVGPEAERLELGDEVAVHLQEVARERLALEEVRDLRLDALAAARDRRDRRGRRDRDEERVAQARARADPRLRSTSQRAGVGAAVTPQASNWSSPRAARVSAKEGWRPFSAASSTEAESAWK